MRTDPIVVFRKGVHRIPVEEYARELRDRLPDHEIRLARTPAEERDLAADAAVVTGQTIEGETLAAAGDLRWFAGMYAGYDHLPLDALAERDVAVTTAAGVHAASAAEHAVGALLAIERDLLRAADRGRRGSWQHTLPGELAGTTALVVGLGSIGGAVCERLAAFDVRTIGIRRSPGRGGPADDVRGPDGLDDGLATADHVVLACPLTDRTRGLIDAEALVTMRPDATLVNVARGAVVDTEALVEALRRGRIGAAALDVTDPEPLPPEHPLWGLENALVTPHTAGATPRYYERLADLIARNVDRAAAGEPLENRVA